MAEDSVTSQLYMDRSTPLGNSEDADGRRALHTLLKNSSLDPVYVSGASTPDVGRTSVALIRNVYSDDPVTTTAYVELLASTPDQINYLNIFDSSGQLLVLATGAAGLEIDQIYIFPGGTGPIDLLIPTATRISVKAISAAASGIGTELDIICLK